MRDQPIPPDGHNPHPEDLSEVLVRRMTADQLLELARLLRAASGQDAPASSTTTARRANVISNYDRAGGEGRW